LQRHRIARAAKLLLVCGVVGIACVPGERPPKAPIRGTLALGPDGKRAAPEESFRVVFAAPQGAVQPVAELSIVFSKPVHALDVAGAPVPPIVIAPPIAGKWLWVGGRALRFVPETTRLPGASSYSVEVPRIASDSKPRDRRS
jgi:hypothetical protein